MTSRAKDGVLGALAGDAASLGLHWIYDPIRLASVAGERPEFREPRLEDYRGTTAYFAHAGKRAGDRTHYGEQLLVALRSLVHHDGALDVADYERRFVDAFGPGGTWVGYIDYATRETLRNLDTAERDALSAARAFDLGSHESERSLMEAKVMANLQRWRGERLSRAMEKAVRITHGEDRELIRIGQDMARVVEEARAGVHGADDAQLPAVSKLPALGAAGVALDNDAEQAVRVTNDRDEAWHWARPVLCGLRAAAEGADPRAAAEAAVSGAEGAVAENLADALAFTGNGLEAAEHFGRACPLPQSVPLWLILLRDAEDFETALRNNVLAGGDSAGRAIILGAALGSIFGAPQSWLERTHARTEAEALLAQLG